MESLNVRSALFCIAVVFAFSMQDTLAAEKKYDPGATDTEIKIGQTVPFSGPASAYATIGKAELAYFKMINAQGGVNGRKINLIQYDDGYNPPKAVEQIRKLVESDEVLLTFQIVGTPTNGAVQKYLNQKKVPQLFASTGASRFNDPKAFPWTMPWLPSIQSEGRIYAKYILAERPDAKIAVLYQNDDYGKDYLKGLRGGLGSKAASMIVMEESYEITDPTIDSHIIKLKSSNADIFFNFTTPKFAAQAIKKISEVGWKPLHILANASALIGNVIEPAGYDRSQGIISAAYLMDANDPQWKDDPGMIAYDQFLATSYPDGNRLDGSVMHGFNAAQALVAVLQKCGDDLTRENVMAQAASLDIRTTNLLPGIIIKTSATNFAPIQQMQLMKFQDRHWELFGKVISGATSE